MSRKSWLGGLGVVAAAAIVGGGVYVLTEPETYRTAPPLTTLTPRSQETAPPTTTSSAAPEPPPLPQDFVAQGMPESFKVECGGETLIAREGLATTVRRLRVADESTRTRFWNLSVDGDDVAIVKDDKVPWAAMPGSDADTVSIWGHANASPPMAFNPIAQFRGDPSDCEATIEVPGGTLGYGYVQAHNVTPKDQQFNKSAELSSMPDKAGKLLVSTCDSAVSEVIWEFRLQSSQAR